MINVNNLVSGMTFKQNNKIFVVYSSHHSKSGRGQAHVKTKVRNLIDNTITTLTFKGGSRVENAFIQSRKAVFLYSEDEENYFMDVKNYEQISLSDKILGENKRLLANKLEVSISYHENNPLDCSFPLKIEYTIFEVEEAVKGDTTSGAMKRAVLDNGLEAMVPLFIKKGDKILLSSENFKYTGKS